jgi:ribonuclease HI
MGLGWVVNSEPQSNYIAAAFGNSNNVAEHLALIEILQ